MLSLNLQEKLIDKKSVNLYVNCSIITLMKGKMNPFYKHEHEIKIEFFTDKKVETNIEART